MRYPEKRALTKEEVQLEREKTWLKAFIVLIAIFIPVCGIEIGYKKG